MSRRKQFSPPANEVNSLEKMKKNVEWMELTIRRNAAQKTLMGTAIDERINAWIDIEINIKKSHPEALLAIQEERNNFLGQIDMDPKDYEGMLQKDLEGREPEPKKDPSEALHAIHSDIESHAIPPPEDEPFPELEMEPDVEHPDVEHPEARVLKISESHSDQVIDIANADPDKTGE